MLMACPACDRHYGGPTMAAFGCCPLCLAEDGRVEQLVYAAADDASWDVPVAAASTTIDPDPAAGGAPLL